MTNCNDAFKTLDDIINVRDVQLSSSDLSELVSLKLISVAGAPGSTAAMNGELVNLKNRLAQLGREKDSLKRDILKREKSDIKVSPRKLFKKDMLYKLWVNNLNELVSEERTLRTKFVELVQNTSEKRNYSRVNGEIYKITYRGREVESELRQRLARVDRMDLHDFIKEMDRIKSHFEGTSKKAHRILKIISPKFPDIDEIHLRSAAVGLSGKSGKPEEAAKLFIKSFKRLQQDVPMKKPAAITLAESLAIMAGNEHELDRLLSKAMSIYKKKWSNSRYGEDALRAVLILMSQEGDAEKLVDIAIRISGSYCSSSLSAAAFIATQYRTQARSISWHSKSLSALSDGGDDLVFQRYSKLYGEISTIEFDPKENVMAAALLTSASIPHDEIIQRYKRSKAILDKFNIGSMIVPAAMITILPVGVEESMDNLRLASGAIGSNKLSLGGIENLSLGMKILMDSAAKPVSPKTRQTETVVPRMTAELPPSVLSITGITIASGLALSAGILAFHEFSMHRIAVKDYAFHPVHSHYIYG